MGASHSTHGERLVALEAWRAVEQPAAQRTRERVRTLELAAAKVAGAALAGSALGGTIAALVVAYMTKGS